MKIVSVCVCVLLMLSSTTMALTSFKRDEQQTKNQYVDTAPIPLPTSGGWMKTFGGIYYDAGYSVQQITDGGYIITGETETFSGRSEIWLIKTDGNGNKKWGRIFGGTDNDVGWCVQQTTDGGFIISGLTCSFGAGSGDVWLIKTDSNGNKLWDKTFGGTNYDDGPSIQQTTDGGYIITGYTDSFGAGNSDVWLIKTDANGNMEWNRTFGGIYSEGGYSVQQASDGGYIIAGGDSHWDVLLIKTDGNGNKLWDKIFVKKGYDTSYSVKETTDGGYIITGQTDVSGANGDVWLIKTDNDGNMEWNRTFGGADYDRGNCVQQTTDGGYILVGITDSFGAGSRDVWLIKTDANGNMEWNGTFGGTGWDEGNSVQQTVDGGYIITGYTFSRSLFIVNGYNIWLIKTDNQGKSQTTSSTNLWFEWLFQRFPNAFPILRHLSGY